jgi:hypothetical protein
MNVRALRHPGINLGPAHSDVEVKAEELMFGFWVFVMSDAVVFGLLFATYVAMLHRQAGGPGPAQPHRLSHRIAHVAEKQKVAYCTANNCGAIVSLSCPQSANEPTHCVTDGAFVVTRRIHLDQSWVYRQMTFIAEGNETLGQIDIAAGKCKANFPLRSISIETALQP